MELGELAPLRLIALLAVLAIAALWALRIAADRRRQDRFAALSRSFGSKVVREGEFLSRFPAEIGGRTFDVRRELIGKKGWCVVTAVPLPEVSDLHSVEIRARLMRSRLIDPRDFDFEKHFVVHDLGYPLRNGWLNDRVRGAIGHFYALELPLDQLGIEEGRLIHRAQIPLQRLDNALLREILTRQGAVADALERAL
jgi:hypothetical protein